MHKREEFAISLRKEKKKKILAVKRAKVLPDVSQRQLFEAYSSTGRQEEQEFFVRKLSDFSFLAKVIASPQTDPFILQHAFA